jgi:hypothetical protein
LVPPFLWVSFICGNNTLIHITSLADDSPISSSGELFGIPALVCQILDVDVINASLMRLVLKAIKG